VPGTDIQAYNANLTTWAGVTPATGVATFLATPTSANFRSVITDESGTGALIFAGGNIGSGSATTATVHDNSTAIATTAYADRAALVGNAPVNLGNLTGTINIDWSQGQMFYGTLTGNTTFTFSNATSGQTIIIDVAQTGTNTFTVTWPTMKWPAGTMPTMTTGAATSDITTVIDLAGTFKGVSQQNVK
jgi:hypothetical protein